MTPDVDVTSQMSDLQLNGAVQVTSDETLFCCALTSTIGAEVVTMHGYVFNLPITIVIICIMIMVVI